MATSGALERDFFVLDGKVLTSGGSLNVTNGVVAIVSNDSKDVNQNGRKVFSSFTGLSKDKVFDILLGVIDKPVSGVVTNKSWESQSFSLDEIEGLRVEVPNRVGLEVDDFIIGYNGVDGTEITLSEKTTTGIDITLSGDAIYNLGYKEGKVTVNLTLQYPYVDDDGVCIDCANGVFSMQEIVEKAVSEFNQTRLIGTNPISDFVEVTVVNSLNATLTGTTDYKYFTLVLTDNGDQSALGRVQAQYPTFKVVRTNRIGDAQTEYTILAPTATTLPAYTTTLPSKIKGCATCPSGYTAIPAGFVYSIALEDDGVSLISTIDDLPGFVTGSAVKIGTSQAGVGTYTVVVTAELTDAQITTFRAISAPASTAVFDLAGDVNAVCKNATVTSTVWVAGTEICQAVAEEYSIRIADDECGVSVLPQLQAQYPTLTIVEGDSSLCQTEFTTTVLSNIVCPECSVEFRALFESEAPDNFGLNVWQKTPETYDPLAKMGIRFTGKPFTLSGSEAYRDDIPFYATSTKLSVAGGQATFIAENWKSHPFPYAVKVLSIAADPEALGGYLYNREDQARYNSDGGFDRLIKNNYGKWLWGQESRVSGLAQYIQYTLTIRPKQYYKLLPHSAIKTNLNFIVEVGRQEALETLLNSISVASGHPAVQALAK